MFWDVSGNFILQLFATFSIITCNFLLQFLSSVAENLRVNKKDDCMKKSYMTD